MKTIWKELVLAVLMGIVMPGILLGVATSMEPPHIETVLTTQAPGQTEANTVEPSQQENSLNVSPIIHGFTSTSQEQHFWNRETATEEWERLAFT